MKALERVTAVNMVSVCLCACVCGKLVNGCYMCKGIYVFSCEAVSVNQHNSSFGLHFSVNCTLAWTQYLIPYAVILII